MALHCQQISEISSESSPGSSLNIPGIGYGERLLCVLTDQQLKTTSVAFADSIQIHTGSNFSANVGVSELEPRLLDANVTGERERG